MRKIIIFTMIFLFVQFISIAMATGIEVRNSSEFRDLPDMAYGFIILKNKNVDEIKADIAGLKIKINEFEDGKILFVQLYKYGFIFKKYRGALIVQAPKTDLSELFANIPWDCDFFDKAGVKLYYESTKTVYHPGTPATPNHPGTPPSTEHKPIYSTLRVTFDDINEALEYFREWNTSNSWEFLRKNDYWGYQQHVGNLHHRTDVAFFNNHKFKTMVFDSLFPINYQRVVDVVGEEMMEKLEAFYR